MTANEIAIVIMFLIVVWWIFKPSAPSERNIKIDEIRDELQELEFEENTLSKMNICGNEYYDRLQSINRKRDELESELKKLKA